MGRIITIASQKGGVGKTTTTLNLGYSLSLSGSRVLLLDCDPQGGMALATNLRKRTELGLINLLLGGISPSEIVMRARNTNLSVAGIGKLDPEDVFMLDEFAKNGTLSEKIRNLAEGFDYLLIDAPAGISGMVTALLAASDAVIPVVLCKALSIKSLPMLLNLVNWVRSYKNPNLVLEGVLLNMLDARNELEKELFEDFRSSLAEGVFFRTTIPLLGVFEHASLRSVPVGMVKDGQVAARQYLDLALELKEREIGHSEGEGDELAAGLF